MTYYPEDILRAADELARRLLSPTQSEILAELLTPTERIAAALDAERKRAIKICEDLPLKDHPGLSAGSEMSAWWSGQEAAARDIASAIRALKDTPK